MMPPIFTVAAADSGVRAALGTSPTRLYPFGSAEQNGAMPYAVWQTVGGSPENFLGSRPDADTYTVQIDVYANTVDSARAGAKALRDAIETHANITLWLGESQDPATGHWRSAMRADWIVQR